MARLEDRWATRDYPMLEWIVEQFEAGNSDIQNGFVPEALGITDAEAANSIRNLDRGNYISDVTWMFGDGWLVGNITERALREVGAWPSNESVADQLLWILEQKIDQAADPDTRSRWVKLRDGFSGAGRDLTIELAAALAAKSMGA